MYISKWLGDLIGGSDDSLIGRKTSERIDSGVLYKHYDIERS